MWQSSRSRKQDFPRSLARASKAKKTTCATLLDTSVRSRTITLEALEQLNLEKRWSLFRALAAEIGEQRPER